MSGRRLAWLVLGAVALSPASLKAGQTRAETLKTRLIQRRKDTI